MLVKATSTSVILPTRYYMAASSSFADTVGEFMGEKSMLFEA